MQRHVTNNTSTSAPAPAPAAPLQGAAGVRTEIKREKIGAQWVKVRRLAEQNGHYVMLLKRGGMLPEEWGQGS